MQGFRILQFGSSAAWRSLRELPRGLHTLVPGRVDSKPGGQDMQTASRETRRDLGETLIHNIWIKDMFVFVTPE